MLKLVKISYRDVSANNDEGVPLKGEMVLTQYIFHRFSFCKSMPVIALFIMACLCIFLFVSERPRQQLG